MKKILYISYDGMTDPLGQSQVIPYVAGLTKNGYSFTLLSFEKKDRFLKYGENIRHLLDSLNIEWVPLNFTRYPPFLSKYWDLYRMKAKAFQLHEELKFDMVHCRSYVSSSVGLALKKKFGVKFFFDMRGFWVDERVDGGLWNLNNPIYKFAYKLYKEKEKQYLNNASTIISLTEAGKKEMESWSAYNNNIPVQVIPCSADFDHFQVVNKEKRYSSREKLGICQDSLVISYLGSIGTWYLLDEMMMLYSKLLLQYPNAKFLFITPDNEDKIISCAQHYNVSAEKIIVRSATRKEVPSLIWASDISLFFIKPSYSKISSSPTKLGEILACGVPVICNAGVGDVQKIIQDTNGGFTLAEINETECEKAIQAVPTLLAMNPEEIRSRSHAYYNLETAIEKYTSCYKSILY
jgi:glycosyltransferase involved in cell wall biosynthesis